MRSAQPKRLLKTMTGHYYELMAAFTRTSSHKLPSAQGALREDALARFVKTWLSNRYSVPTNVFASSRAGKEFHAELDVVIHDGNSGGLWPLDAEGGNSVASWEEIRLIVQVKSTLKNANDFDKACKSMDGIFEFAEEAGTKLPYRALFAYRVENDFLPFLLEKFTYSNGDAFPFDAFFLLEHGAFFSRRLQELRIGIEKGLGPGLVRNDGPAQDRIILEECIESYIPNGYRYVRDSTSEYALLSLAALATLATSGEDATQALIAAFLHSKHHPIFEKS